VHETAASHRQTQPHCETDCCQQHFQDSTCFSTEAEQRTMSSYLSNLLTQTTSRYNSIRRTLLSNEDDGDTEDDSHISRVLRAYYTEKGRPFPPWLPPDPKDNRSITPTPYAQTASSYFNSMTGGNKSQYAPVQNQNQAGTRSSLSDLWDPPAAQPSAPVQPQSLRAGRRPPVSRSMPSSNPASTLAPQGRPLPSQRAGSYQTMQSQQPGRSVYDQMPPPSSGGSGTAQDRLKARLVSLAGHIRLTLTDTIYFTSGVGVGLRVLVAIKDLMNHRLRTLQTHMIQEGLEDTDDEAMETSQDRSF
jgi:hypothetical protein